MRRERNERGYREIREAEREDAKDNTKQDSIDWTVGITTTAVEEVESSGSNLGLSPDAMSLQAPVILKPYELTQAEREWAVRNLENPRSKRKRRDGDEDEIHGDGP